RSRLKRCRCDAAGEPRVMTVSDVVAGDCEAPVVGQDGLIVLPGGKVCLHDEGGRVAREPGAGDHVRSPGVAADRDLALAVHGCREWVVVDDRESVFDAAAVLEAVL